MKKKKTSHRVLDQARVVQELEQLPDQPRVRHHHVVVGGLPPPRLPELLGLRVRPEVHVGRVEPHEERLAGVLRARHEVDGLLEALVVDRLHALFRQGPRVGDLAVLAVEDAAGGVVLAEVGEVLLGGVVCFFSKFFFFFCEQMMREKEEKKKKKTERAFLLRRRRPFFNWGSKEIGYCQPTHQGARAPPRRSGGRGFLFCGGRFQKSREKRKNWSELSFISSTDGRKKLTLFRNNKNSLTEKLLEAVVGRQVLVQIAQVVLPELARAQARGAHRRGQGAVLAREADLGAGHADLGQPRAVGAHAREEGGAAGGAGLLAVVVGELDALLGEAVDLFLI